MCSSQSGVKLYYNIFLINAFETCDPILSDMSNISLVTTFSIFLLLTCLNDLAIKIYIIMIYVNYTKSL